MVPRYQCGSIWKKIHKIDNDETYLLIDIAVYYFRRVYDFSGIGTGQLRHQQMTKIICCSKNTLVTYMGYPKFQPTTFEIKGEL